MSDISSPSGERQESHDAKGHNHRARQVILIGTMVACTAGLVTTSLSSFSPPKTSAAAYPPSIDAQQNAPASTPPDTASESPLPSPKQTAQPKSEQPRTQQADVVPARYAVDADPEFIPALALMAYRRAAYEQANRTPACHLPWTLLAAIGKVESNHARGGELTGDGFTTSPILGPVLDGTSFAARPDSDQGKIDGDTKWDRAVGPMQFIPPTWKRWGTTTRRTGAADPSNMFDASTSAASYLCAHNRDLNDPLQLNQAILSYNHSEKYLRDVLAWNSAYVFGRPYVGTDMSGVGNGLTGLANVQDSPSARPASPTKAVVSALRKGARQVAKKISAQTGARSSTSFKATPQPTTLPSQRATASPQPEQAGASPSVTPVPPVRLPVFSPQPPRRPLLETLLQASKAPSRSRATPSPSPAQQGATQLSSLVRRLGDALPSSSLLRGSLPTEVPGVSALTGE